MITTTRPFLTRIALAAFLAAGALTSAHADMTDGIVDIWNVKVDTVFDTTTICDTNNKCTQPNGITVTNNQSLRWGESTGQGRSGLDISDSPSSQNVNTNGAAVPNVSITHLNRPVTGTSLKSLDILSTLTLTPVAPPDLGLPATTLTFKVYFAETPNGANPCADGSTNGVGINSNGCADIYVTDANSLNFPFYYDLDGASGSLPNQLYYISFFEASSGLNALPSGACSAVGQPAPCLGFRTAEGKDTTVQFAAMITTKPVQIEVPEPGTLALVGASLFGLAALRRRRST